MKVAVSAGHNPVAPGAAYNGLTEHAAALVWCADLKAALEAYGHDVFEVPTGGLTAKVGAINAEKCDAAIEIHFNSDGGHAGHGCETLYMPGSTAGEQFARAVQHHLAGVFAPDRGAKEGWYRMDRPGHADFPGDVEGDEVADAFLRLTHCPAVIVEPCFIHDLGSVKMHAEGGAALARGITDYLAQ